ncbi:Na+/H+ antiporter subunit E [Corticibacterium sp. UT-5YL-CI-8]|nr:Na+/H+ antiporter subunit E [Tianweitania sp. UT-5YL-CI-8]
MSRILPYPLLTLSLLVLWLLLQQSASPGHILLGLVAALLASRAMAALQPEKPRVVRFLPIFRLVGRVVVDILASNIAVSRLILNPNSDMTKSGFLTVPLVLKDRFGLAILSCIVTATPGSAWLEYNPEESEVLIHVLDIENDQEWIDTLKNRYEILLLEIFG